MLETTEVVVRCTVTHSVVVRVTMSCWIVVVVFEEVVDDDDGGFDMLEADDDDDGAGDDTGVDTDDDTNDTGVPKSQLQPL